MAKYNDIDMKKWKEYEDVSTDTLWIINKRDNSGLHSGHYHGNFVPQIPHQLLTRYTKKGDWVLDPFMGSGTTLIESQKMGRNSIGIELQQSVVAEVTDRLLTKINEDVKTIIINDNSKTIDLNHVLESNSIKKFQFIIFHPPYWDIIKFSDDKEDISNTDTLESFMDEFEKIIDNTTIHLEKNRYCALVIGDKYSNSQITPLGFNCMNLFLKKDFILKAILVKNFGDTEGKNNKHSLWRYRALSSDFYIFKHEYIMIFKKVK